MNRYLATGAASMRMLATALVTRADEPERRPIRSPAIRSALAGKYHTVYLICEDVTS